MANVMERIVAAIALKVTKLNVDSVCLLFLHQPKLPEGSDKLKKASKSIKKQ